MLLSPVALNGVPGSCPREGYGTASYCMGASSFKVRSRAEAIAPLITRSVSEGTLGVLTVLGTLGTLGTLGLGILGNCAHAGTTVKTIANKNSLNPQKDFMR